MFSRTLPSPSPPSKLGNSPLFPTSPHHIIPFSTSLVEESYPPIFTGKVDNLWITFYIPNSMSAESALRAVTFFAGYRLTDYLAPPKQEQKPLSVEGERGPYLGSLVRTPC